LLRRYLTCHYCGAKSGQKYSSGLRNWQCSSCDAANYLDEQGQITDPPTAPEGPNQPVRYASFTSRPTAPNSIVFCDACVSNQHFYAQTLANYLPDTDHPQYHEYVKKLPEFKQNLEKRYPQYCRECAEKADKVIKNANYLAKTDNLRLNIERTRQNGPVTAPYDPGFREFMVRLAGLLWWISVLGEFVWHAFAFALVDEVQEEASNITIYLSQCAIRGLKTGGANPACFRYWTELMPTLLYISALTFWWNNKLRGKLQRPNARLSGMRENILLQLIVLGIRVFIFLGFWDTDSLSSPSMRAQFKGAHAATALILTMFLLSAHRVVKLSYRQVNFKEPTTTLLSSFPASQTNVSTPVRRTPHLPSNSTPFPIHKLSSPSTDGFLDPPSPAESTASTVIEDWSFAGTSTQEEQDSMDWTPTRPQYDFNPSVPASASPVQHTNTVGLNGGTDRINNAPFPSPFTGSLPRAPIPPAHKLRNPLLNPAPPKPTQPHTVQFVKPVIVQNPFSTVKEALRTDFPLAQGGLKMRESAPETGLEEQFGSFFSLAE
ncbi:hypothetical protein M501DRAFT_911466, partial [Patellaria atrata CBS 101060]